MTYFTGIRAGLKFTKALKKVARNRARGPTIKLAPKEAKEFIKEGIGQQKLLRGYARFSVKNIQKHRTGIRGFHITKGPLGFKKLKGKIYINPKKSTFSITKHLLRIRKMQMKPRKYVGFKPQTRRAERVFGEWIKRKGGLRVAKRTLSGQRNLKNPKIVRRFARKYGIDV